MEKSLGQLRPMGCATFLAMSMKGTPTSLGVELLFAVIVVVSLVLS
jgi:hypothetical protein